MNLMKLFNTSYLTQNLKKSSLVLSIFIGLIPILNTIILTMILTTNKNYLLSFEEISILNFIGIYILPIIISICLFNYIYKKKSVDFINSMPISRKSIFITNFISGIFILAIMLLINIILILVLLTIFNTNIPLMMLIDYFWFFLVVYIFTFSATNLAMTISGNAITQIIVTLLILFLVPFSDAYITLLKTTNNNTKNLIECTKEECIPKEYYCYDDSECSLNKEINRYQVNLTKVKENNYTTPFGLLYGSITSKSSLINTISVIKMIVLSIIYTIIGCLLFIKRKMEVSETSFKNPHIHNLVKSLTLIPIAAFSYIVLREKELIFTIFVLVIMLIYYFVYDLITKRNIGKIKLSLLYFVTTIIILTTIFSNIDKEKNTNNILNYNDIKEVAIDLDNYSKRININNLYTDNKKLISIITKELLAEDDHSSNLNYPNIYLKTKDNQEYKSLIGINTSIYNEIINLLSVEKEYINYYKNIDTNKVYAIKIGNKIYSKTAASSYLDLINNSLKELSLKEYLELQRKYNYISDDFYIKLYTYKNHNQQEISINGYINYDLLNTIVNSNNSILKENLTTDIQNHYLIYYINSYLEDEYNIDYYVLKSAKNEIYNFILKDLTNKIDMRKEYITLEININYNSYQFTTNNVEELINILETKYKEIKDTPDYQNYTKESVEYYD